MEKYDFGAACQLWDILPLRWPARRACIPGCQQAITLQQQTDMREVSSPQKLTPEWPVPGNDLARCLNWGGGLYVLRDRGLPAMLHDVEHATVSLLDRWAVQITRQPQELSSAAQQIQRMSSLVARDKPEAEQVHILMAQLSSL